MCVMCIVNKCYVIGVCFMYRSVFVCGVCIVHECVEFVLSVCVCFMR